LDVSVNGIRRRIPALRLGMVLVAVGCTESGRDARRPATTSARPNSPPATRSAAYGITCLHGAERAAAFRFRVGEGLSTVGVILGQGRNGLAFGHQLGSNLCEWVPMARSYGRLGYRALVFDFRGYNRLDDDVVATVAELRRRGVTKVVLVGSSMGGTAVLLAATRIRPAVAGVASLSGPAEFMNMDVRTAVPRLRVPALFMAARRDGPFADAARGLFGAASTRDKQLLVLSSAAHGTNLLTFGNEGGKARVTLRGFITAHLRR
jgi:pimeloyl-ACP methyl ester carboxylesterase